MLASAEVGASDEKISPVSVSFPQRDIDDLRRRVEITRWPEAGEESEWPISFPLPAARKLATHWVTGYNWRRFERQLNELPNFLTRIDGVGIHYIHVRSEHPNALPILLTHGMPGNFSEFLKVVHPLTDPTVYGGTARDAFHVVIPSIPGAGFSESPGRDAWSIEALAHAWVILMGRLGYDRWVAQGAEFGAAVTAELASLRPTGLLAIHTNLPPAVPRVAGAVEPFGEHVTLTGERNRLPLAYDKSPCKRFAHPFGNSVMATALAACERLNAACQNGPNLGDLLTEDELLDFISLHCLSGSSDDVIGNNAVNDREPDMEFVPGLRVLSGKLEAVAVGGNMLTRGKMDLATRFAALFQPYLFTDEMRRAFQGVR